MRRYVGIAVILVGFAHLLFVAVARRLDLAAIFRGGIVNAIEPHPEREAAFWSLCFGVLVVTTGVLIAKFQEEERPAPAVAGWVLLGMGLVGGILMPFSGFWAVVPLGLLLLLPERKDAGVMR